jgi:hypothetical protein
VNDTASFPERSCTAAFDIAVLVAGATYATVITANGPSAGEIVRTTVDPLTTALVGTNASVPAVTENAPATAVVACNGSLKVNTTVVPFALSAPDVRVGSDISTPALP